MFIENEHWTGEMTQCVGVLVRSPLDLTDVRRELTLEHCSLSLTYTHRILPAHTGILIQLRYCSIVLSRFLSGDLFLVVVDSY